MRTLFAIGMVAVVLTLATFHACKKEKIIIQGSRTDTIYIQYEHCQYDTSLPINCYTTHLRSGFSKFRATSDTFIIGNNQCVILGNCDGENFQPVYKICAEIIPGRIPDTAMCRAAGLPLCCPSYYSESPCLQATQIPEPPHTFDLNDISTVTLTVSNICQKTQKDISLNLLGPTLFIMHPDSNPNFICQDYLRPLFQNACQSYTIGNCTMRLVDIPRKYEPDTVRLIYLEQGEPNPIGVPTLIPCCAPAYKTASSSNPFNATAKIEIACN